MPDLYGEASSLLQGAARTKQAQNELELEQQKIKENRQIRTADAISGGITKGAEQYFENKRAGATNATILERERMQQEGANKRQQQDFDAQFITITPQLAKGAIGVTGDNGWNDLIGQKLRADVYSAMLSARARLAERQEPRTFEIEEGDKVYTAEYDPKTRQLRKLTTGSNKFSPDQRDGKKGSGGTPLNPLTLQNIVRQDEKTLLTQLGGKGAKGIPQASGIDKLLNTLSRGKIEELDDKETAKLATLRSLATRLKNNYVNLNNLETERGMQPTSVDPEIMQVIDKLLAPPEQGAAGTTVLMRTKGGKEVNVPKDKVEEALKRGATRVTR